MNPWRSWAVAALVVAWGTCGTVCLGQQAVRLPDGVRAVWDLGAAARETTPTRERVCINGLWQWQPADPLSDRVPESDWGYFKVPGAWPGITDYMQKDFQTVHAHPRWKDTRLSSVTAAWYQREITIADNWTGRRIAVSAEYLNSYAVVYVDGRRAGELRFPAGEVEIGSLCRPGGRHTLSLLVVAMPLQGVRMSYNDSNAAREVRGSVARRGLCGDVFLTVAPADARIGDIRLDTSVREQQMTVDAELLDLAPDAAYSLRVQVKDDGQVVKTFTSPAFDASGLESGRVRVSEPWLPDKLWDTHTPEHQYEMTVSLLDADGKPVDIARPVRFGFREFWIDGRDFYLNGSRIFLSAVPLDNAQVGAALATYEGARESLERLQSFGINFVYTHNYDCQPGSHLSFAEILRAADDVGMLVALSQPHFSDYDWQAADAEQTNGYAGHAAFYVRVAQHHPSVVMYATSHNATGYNEDMNPDLIDGIYDQRSSWAMNNVRRALRAEAIVRGLDPGRIVYHHSSGNLSPMHTSNFYPNFVPVQELSDWFEHWATVGVKPFFACEYGAPFTWDWAMYRGWFKGAREFGSAAVPWDFCLAEWNSQFVGDAAFRISEQEKRNLRWESERFRSGRLWHRWDYPHQLGSTDFDERYPVLANYLEHAWRAFRTWGVSAISPWEHHVLWKLRPGMDRNRRVELATDWQNLQRPGFSPDFLEQRYERMDLAYERSDWLATPAAEAMYRNNRPLLAYLAGKPARFTSQDHNFLPGETVEKQIVAINNSRVPVICRYEWAFGAGQAGKPDVQAAEVRIETGQQARIPVRVALPVDLAPGSWELTMTARFRPVDGDNDDVIETQTDRLTIHVLPSVEPVATRSPVRDSARIALFDPSGETNKLLADLGVRAESVQADADLADFDLLVIGRAALSAEGPAPDLRRVADGLRVLVFEQTAEALEKRLGFRVVEYGLRNVFARVPDHPVLAGLADQHLRDWRGEATLVPPRLECEPSPRYNGAPTVRWCGLEVPRLWRCGNRGNVASVSIEKPARGDFLPIVDGGFSLQYSPLLEYREGSGMVLFCQLDVTGRTESEPVADRLIGNLLEYVSSWKPAPRRQAIYAGDPNGRAYFAAAGLTMDEYQGGDLASDQVLVVAPGGGAVLAPHASKVARWLEAGGHLLALELDAAEANLFLPSAVSTAAREHIAAHFDPQGETSLLAGVGPADVHNREPRNLPLVTGGARAMGNGVLARQEAANVVFCQLAPYRISRAGGLAPSLTICDQEAFDGKYSALVTMGTVPWAQFGQKVSAGQVGKTYTLAVFVKCIGDPVTVRLEMERAGQPWDRVFRGEDTLVQGESWQELHVTFQVDKPFPEGWQAYLHCGQEGARFRADLFRLYEGPYVPGRSGAGERDAQAGQDLTANSSFEAAAAPWFFNWPAEQQNLRRTYRRSSFLVTRLLANMGVAAETPLLSRFAVPASGATSDSIVRNGDFRRSHGDDVPDDWQFVSESKHATWQLEAGEPEATGRILRIARPAADRQDRASVMLAQQDVPVQAGQWYRIRLRAKAEGLAADGVTLALQNTRNWQSLFEYQRFTPEPTWKEFTFLVQANATAESRTRFQIWHGSTGTLWLSEVSMTPCDPPTEGRWTRGLYADQPQEWDDPYRFFRW
jgi:beta-galactosidase